MTQENFLIFGEKSKFAIEVNLLLDVPSISFWAESIAKDAELFSISPFVAEKFLSCMSEAWGRLFLEQTYPFPSERTIFSPQHFVFINKNIQERSIIEKFEQAHNVGSWLDGVIEIYFMRQGRYIEITWERETFAFPLHYIMDLFTSLGNFLASNLSEKYKELWNSRESISADNLITYASGISDMSDALREFITQRVSFSFRDLIADHPYLAIARMSQSSNLSTSDAFTAIKTIQAISRTKTDEKKHMSLPLWVNNIPYSATDSRLKPYEQAYVLADYVRKNIEELESYTGKIQIYPLLSSLGYDVFEKELPDKIHALCVWHSDIDQFVVLNTSDNALGFSNNHLHRAAMAHELCHILLDKDRSRPLIDLALVSQDDPTEKRARAFAAELLLPRALAIQFITEREDKRETVELLSWKYEVSLSITAYQLINGAELTGKQLPPCILDYTREIKERSYYYDDSEAKLNSIIDEIQALKELRPGWYEGSGSVPSHNGLSWLVGNIEGSFHPQTLIVPGIFPTPEGHVQLEWDLGSYQGILEFDLENKRADWLMFCLDTPEKGEELKIDLSSASGWTELTNCITELMEVAAND